MRRPQQVERAKELAPRFLSVWPLSFKHFSAGSKGNQTAKAAHSTCMATLHTAYKITQLTPANVVDGAVGMAEPHWYVAIVINHSRRSTPEMLSGIEGNVIVELDGTYLAITIDTLGYAKVQINQNEVEKINECVFMWD